MDGTGVQLGCRVVVRLGVSVGCEDSPDDMVALYSFVALCYVLVRIG